MRPRCRSGPVGRRAGRGPGAGGRGAWYQSTQPARIAYYQNASGTWTWEQLAAITIGSRGRAAELRNRYLTIMLDGRALGQPDRFPVLPRPRRR